MPVRLLPKAISSNLRPALRLSTPGSGFPRVSLIEKLAESYDSKGNRGRPHGTIYVSSRDSGTISIAFGIRSTARIVLTKPNVHGMAIHEGRLFFITIREIFSAPIKADGTLGPEERLADDLPDAGQHPNRTIGFGPDGTLYVSVGSTRVLRNTILRTPRF